MKSCLCKKSVGTSLPYLYDESKRYKYEIHYIECYSQMFKMYKVYNYNDYTNFVNFDFDQYFITEQELRKEKLEKLENYESR